MTTPPAIPKPPPAAMPAKVDNFLDLYLLLGDPERIPREIEKVPIELLLPIAHRLNLHVATMTNTNIKATIARCPFRAKCAAGWFIEKGGGVCPA